MRFLVDASLPRLCAALMRRHGHDADDVRDIGLRCAADPVIARHAKENRVSLVSADFDFADIRVYPPSEYHGIVVINRPPNANVAEVLAMLDGLLGKPAILAALPGRLAIVDAKRIRLQPPLPRGTQ
ncbi:MAG TPA: DUF5615 family PIN-like protein [Tepidisphaeraceae bacterium]|nr:DUF5615 family PIN-like protein [Tepidisphaeraceae bacterium]